MQEFFEFSLGARVLYQIGLAGELGQVISSSFPQRRAFIVADKGVVQAGLLDPIQAGLAPIEVVGMFDDVPANSSVAKVAEGAEQAQAADADLIIAVGGGSPIDTAKGIRILLTLGGSIPDYEGYNVIDTPLTPLVAIPTTAGTGSEVTPEPLGVMAELDDGTLIDVRHIHLHPGSVTDPHVTTTPDSSHRNGCPLSRD